MKKFLSKLFVLTVVLIFSSCGLEYFLTDTRPNPPSVSRPLSPGSRYVWVEGEWRWNGNNYAWQNGYWTLPPSNGARWNSGEWKQKSQKWYWQPGHWRK